MSRPGDWHLVGLWTDPTPGESWQVREIASVYGATSSAANQTGQLVRAALQASGTGIWHGQAGDAFREQLGEFPTQVEACETSYATARDAMNWWAGRLEDNQANADRGLEQARAADGDLRAAQVALDSALSNARTTSAALEQVERNQVRYATTTPPPGWTAPTPGEIARARRAASTAATARAAAERASADAQSRLDVASRLVAEAAASYQEDAATAINRIEQATDQALPENSLWRKIYESDAWGVIVTIATVVVIVAAIAAFILTGPIAAIVGMIATIAGVLLMLNDIAAWQAGDAAGWQAALSVVLTVIPGGVLLKAGKRATNLLADTATAIAPRFTGLATGFLRTARGVASEGLLRITRITDPWVARINEAIAPGFRQTQANLGATTHPSGLRYSDGTPRTTAQQIADPQIHPSNARIVPDDYDAWGGTGSREAFLERYYSRVDPDRGSKTWDWPKERNGAVPGSTVRHTVTPSEQIVVDRIGLEPGTFFSDTDASFPSMSLPIDRLGWPRERFRVDMSHPLITEGRFDVESSIAAPGFGQPGGARQHQYFIDGQLVNDRQMERLGLFGLDKMWM